MATAHAKPLAATACYMQHPDLGPNALPLTTKRFANQPTWTLDMDDVLRAAVRRTSFDFEASSQQVCSYVERVRIAGGILPDEVAEALYTARACRERWSQLDLSACRAYHNVTQPQNGAAAAAAAKNAADADEAPPLSSSDDEGNDYGIVDLGALRAQRMGGSVPPSSKPKSTSTAAAKPRVPVRRPAAPARPQAPPAAPEPLPDFTPLLGRSQQLAELEQLATTLSNGTGGGRAAPTDDDRAFMETVDAMDADAAEHRKQAATMLREPLGELKRRMEGLEALLSNETTDMAATLSEVAQAHREMAELQSIAHRAQTTAPLAGGAGEAGAWEAPQADSTPLRYEPATSGGLNLEAVLDGMDLDGLIASLEKDRGGA